MADARLARARRWPVEVLDVLRRDPPLTALVLALRVVIDERLGVVPAAPLTLPDGTLALAFAPAVVVDAPCWGSAVAGASVEPLSRAFRRAYPTDADTLLARARPLLPPRLPYALLPACVVLQLWERAPVHPPSLRRLQDLYADREGLLSTWCARARRRQPLERLERLEPSRRAWAMLLHGTAPSENWDFGFGWWPWPAAPEEAKCLGLSAAHLAFLCPTLTDQV